MARALLFVCSVATAYAFQSNLPVAMLRRCAPRSSASTLTLATAKAEVSSPQPTIAEMPSSKDEVVQHDLKGSPLPKNLETIRSLGHKAPIAALAATILLWRLPAVLLLSRRMIEEAFVREATGRPIWMQKMDRAARFFLAVCVGALCVPSSKIVQASLDVCATSPAVSAAPLVKSIAKDVKLSDLLTVVTAPSAKIVQGMLKACAASPTVSTAPMAKHFVGAIVAERMRNWPSVELKRSKPAKEAEADLKEHELLSLEVAETGKLEAKKPLVDGKTDAGAADKSKRKEEAKVKAAKAAKEEEEEVQANAAKEEEQDAEAAMEEEVKAKAAAKEEEARAEEAAREEVDAKAKSAKEVEDAKAKAAKEEEEDEAKVAKQEDAMAMEAKEEADAEAKVAKEGGEAKAKAAKEEEDAKAKVAKREEEDAEGKAAKEEKAKAEAAKEEEEEAKVSAKEEQEAKGKVEKSAMGSFDDAEVGTAAAPKAVALKAQAEPVKDLKAEVRAVVSTDTKIAPEPANRWKPPVGYVPKRVSDSD